MVKLLLNNNKWTEYNNIWFSGYIIVNDAYIMGAKAIRQINIPTGFDDFAKLINNLNGRFSIVVTHEKETWVASDKLRSIPLFFTKEDGNNFISDSIENIFGNNTPINPERKAVDVFLRTGYTINNYSLVKNVFIIEPAEIIRFHNDEWKKQSYLSHPKPKNIADVDIVANATQLKEVLHLIFKRLFNALGTRPIVIPLSGGYDSRLIAYMAKMYHKGSIQTYTYGVKNNCEIANAKKTAETLGLKWIFIEYNKELIEDFTNCETFKSYYPYASNYSSLFWLQDYFAVKKLKDDKIVADNSVFIPGLSADAIAGVTLSKKKISKNTALKIFSENFNLINSSKSQKVSIVSEIEKNYNHGVDNNWETLYKWNVFNRQAKFVANSARVYNFFGYDFYIPYWDNEFLFFFLELPFELRTFKKLYNDVVEQIFKNENLLFERELQPSKSYRRFQNFKNKIKKHLPTPLVRSLTNNKSPFYYEEITMHLRKEIKREELILPKQPNYFNAYIAQWYLQSIFKNHSL